MTRPRRLYRRLAAVFFLLAAVAPVSIWALYLFFPAPERWRIDLEYALSAENQYRGFYLLLVIAAIFNSLSIRTVLTASTRKALNVLLVGSTVIAVAYLSFAAWTLALGAAVPIWYVYKASHEV